MDKFTVDLEKVLDEFEYNEGREESVVPAVIRNHNFSHTSPKNVRPPAANYRRPAFEPISLADADFAAAPSSVSDQIINLTRQKNLKDSNFNINECFSSSSKYYLDEVINQNNTSDLHTINGEDLKETIPDSPSNNDYKPDLLDSNSLKQSQNGLSHETDTDIHQLPDITSVRSLPQDLASKESQVFDLIKPHIYPPNENESPEELPPIVDVGSIIKDELPPLQLTPISFDSVDVSQSDIVNYLDSLADDKDNLGEEIPIDVETKVNDLSINFQLFKIKPLEKSEPDSITESVTSDSFISTPSTSFSDYHCSVPVHESGTSSETNFNNTCFNECISDKSVEPSINQELVSSNQTDSDCDVETHSETNSKAEKGLIANVLIEETTQTHEKEESVILTDDTVCNKVSTLNNEFLYQTQKSKSDKLEDSSDNITSASSVKQISQEPPVANPEINENRNETTDGNNELDDLESPSECSLPSTVTLESEINTSDEILPSGVSSGIVYEWSPDEQGSELELVLDKGNSLKVCREQSFKDIDQGTCGPIGQVSSIECYCPENASSDEIQNLKNIETERESLENRDNEEKAVVNRIGCEESDENSGAQAVDSPEGEVKPSRPSTLAIPHTSHMVTDSEESPTPSNSSGASLCGVMSPEERSLGKMAPYWVPDTETDCCMLCNTKFTVIKRRHHCRACGFVVCSKCSNLKASLEYMENAEARVCQPCFNIIKRGMEEGRYNRGRQPNPNNPMEYCSTVPPPLQQGAAAAAHLPPPAVFVPTSVLKREGSKSKSETPKQVIFSDGIRPGGDLTELDGSSESTPRLLPRRYFSRKTAQGHHGPGSSDSGNNRSSSSGGSGSSGSSKMIANNSLKYPPMDPGTQSWIPSNGDLPPLCTLVHGVVTFQPEGPSVSNISSSGGGDSGIVNAASTASVALRYAINSNLTVLVARTKLSCCVSRLVWVAASQGLCLVGQDEIVLVLECLPEETNPPVDIFHLVNLLWKQAALGNTSSEMSFTQWPSGPLFGSADHAGFLYIRPTLQCTTNLILPPPPFLVAILVHRWEVPWARLFPLRLVLRLGAEYRYYPTPLVSIRNRQPLYTDIGHTIMKILVDFRKFSYSLATVRGLLIHVEDRQTTILFPRNRYDQVTRALNNSESVLAFGANLSLIADSHLVCMQGTKDDDTAYHTEAINIHNKPRRVTGASFVVFNGALKVSQGLSSKSSIVEDGLMVHLSAERMTALKTALRLMKDFPISCGPNGEETVLLKWTADDTYFNIGVKSCIDGRSLEGIPSIRVHNGTDFPYQNRLIRWTEVFILQCEDSNKAGGEPLDISRVSESLARATCSALLSLLETLASSDLLAIAVRATIHQDNVGYEAGSCGTKLPTSCMNRLDDELVPVLHQAAIASPDSPAVLELLFRIINMP